jgi:hypothetical protein
MYFASSVAGALVSIAVSHRHPRPRIEGRLKSSDSVHHDARVCNNLSRTHAAR